MARAPTPSPVQTPPIVAFDDVTYGIGAVVDVEERALRALEHDRLPFPPRLVEEHRHVGHPPAHPFPAALEIVVDLPPVHRRLLDQPVARVDVVADGFGERVRVGEIADAHAAARDLVLVGRTDAARGRADLALAAPRFAEQVELAVVRQDEVRLVADHQPVADGDAGALELVDLGEQRLRIDDHAVADDAGDAVVQDAGRQQAQHELAPVGVDGVPGIVTALVAGDDGKIGREQVDDFALAFITPLGAEHRDVHKRLIVPNMSAGSVRQISLDGESLTPAQLADIADGDVTVALAPSARCR